MREFETLLLFSPELPTEEREKLIASLTGIIERDGGKTVEIDQWGMRDLAYPVHKHMRGFYVRLVYQAPSALIAELERNIRINDSILKFLTVKLAEKVSEEA